MDNASVAIANAHRLPRAAFFDCRKQAVAPSCGGFAAKQDTALNDHSQRKRSIVQSLSSVFAQRDTGTAGRELQWKRRVVADRAGTTLAGNKAKRSLTCQCDSRSREIKGESEK